MESVRNRPAWNIADLDPLLSGGILACLTAFVCYQADRLVYVLGIPPDHIASFWPPTAFLVVVLLLAPRKIWPVLMAAGLGAMAVADLVDNVPIVFEVWISLGNLVEVLVAALGIRRLFNGTPQLSNLKNLAKYALFAVILVPFTSALVGAIGSVPGTYGLQWRLWFFADALAFLTVGPAVLNWVREGREWSRDPHNYLELAALMILLVFFGYLTFVGTGRAEQPALLYSLVPLLLWAALRLGLKGVSTSMLVIALLSIWGAANGRGPFAAQGPLNNALSLQLFLFFAAIPFTVLAVRGEDEKAARHALIDKHAELRQAQRLARIGSWRWDVGSDTVIWSDELYRIAGRNLDLPVPTYKEHPQLYTPESWRRLDAAVETTLRTGAPYDLDLEMVSADGSTRSIVARGEAVRDASGLVVQLRGTAQDITVRKRMEKALRKSEERFRMAAQAGKMLAYEWDATTDVLVRSEGAAEMLGVGEETHTTGREVLSMIPPEDRGKTECCGCQSESCGPLSSNHLSHGTFRRQSGLGGSDQSCALRRARQVATNRRHAYRRHRAQAVGRGSRKRAAQVGSRTRAGESSNRQRAS